MTLSDISIKNPVLAWMILIGTVVFGAIAYTGLGVSQMPDVNFPVLTVSIPWTGAAPDVVETSVTDVVEQAVMGVEGVIEMTSTSSRGRSNITIQFDLGTDVDTALQQVQSKLSSVSRDLPYDIDPPEITKSNPDDTPIIWLAYSGNRPTRFMMEYVKDHLNDQFASIPGVASVSLGGYLEPSLRVWLNPDKMKAKELTSDDVVAAIQAGHNEMPAGTIDNNIKEVSMRVLGEAGTAEEFSKIIIPSRKGVTIWQPFKIEDVARVEDGLEDAKRFARTPDGLAVGLGILKQPGSNAVDIAHRIKAKVKEMQKILPQGTTLEVRFDSTKFVEDSAADMNFIIFLSVILTALVCWLFLGSFGTALNVSLTIPMALFGTFFVIKMMGFTLNTFTFLGLSLVIGIVVDDAIMVVENISRHRELGEGKIKAALVGSREITFAALAATIAILAIFLPVIFMQGVIGKYFFQFGITISAAVALSLLGALTITPMYSSQYLKEHVAGKKTPFMEKAMDNLREGYVKFLKVCLANRWKVIGVSISLFILSLLLFGTVKKEFVPSQDQARLSISMATAPGTAIAVTDEVFKQAETIASKRPDVDSFFSVIGTGDSSKGSLNLTLKDKSKRPADKEKGRVLTQQEIGDQLRRAFKKIPGVSTVNIIDLSLTGFTAKRSSPVDFMLVGPDWGKLADYSGTMVKEMENTGLMVDADTDYKEGVTEALIMPDRTKAALRSVSMQTIGNALSAMYGGIKAGKFTGNGKRYDVMVMLEEKNRNQMQDIQKMLVRNDQGVLIRLSDVIKVVEKPAVSSITRENRERAIHVFANVTTGKAQGDAMKAVEDIGKKILPDGYRIVFTGGSASFKDSFNSLYIALILGIFVAYMVLGTQFNSFVHPLSVLLALPFSLTGAFLALAISGKSLNIYSAIGIILLMGIVKKNSILLVDFTNQRREAGRNVYDALVEACPIRLRPIVMTSAATIAAAIPPALALGPGAETRVPMAVVVIGGVIFSTFFTLFVVPCAYSLLSNLENKQHMIDVHSAMGELAEVAETNNVKK
jgi:HAE1 family hydrophobic/amphiphilic exporter-1